MKKDWVVETADVSIATGGLAITGVNNCTSVEIDRNFSWNISHHSIDSDRYDWSNTLWGPGAKEAFDRLVSIKNNK